MRLAQIRARHCAFSAAIFVLMFSNIESYSVQIQVLGVSLLGLAAALSIIHSPRLRLFITAFDLIIFLMFLLSFIASSLNQESYVVTYTFIFLATYLCVMHLCRAMDHAEIVFCIYLAVMMTITVVAITYFGDLWQTLQPGDPNRWAHRFRPFDMHPDLTGYVYGGFIVVILFSSVSVGRFRLPMKFGAVALCVMISLASSARAGLVALLGTIAIYIARSATLRGKNTKYVVLTAVGVTILALIFQEKIVGYLTHILELDSSSRGLDSGGSGRLAIWQRGVSLVGDRTWEFYIGSGLRSSSEGVLGFFTESSYISIAVDSGVLILILFVGYLLRLMLQLYRQEGRRDDPFGRLVLYCVTFAVFQSVFNRYLLAIGNPFSLIFLILTSKMAVNQAIAKRDALRRSRDALWNMRMRRLHPAS